VRLHVFSDSVNMVARGASVRVNKLSERVLLPSYLFSRLLTKFIEVSLIRWHGIIAAARGRIPRYRRGTLVVILLLPTSV
jgi:hypothetical protein